MIISSETPREFRYSRAFLPTTGSQRFFLNCSAAKSVASLIWAFSFIAGSTAPSRSTPASLARSRTVSRKVLPKSRCTKLNASPPAWQPKHLKRRSSAQT